MKAKFFRSDDNLGLGLQFEPETTDEQLLLEAFTREAHASNYRLQFHGFEHNMFGRPLSKGLTAVRGSIIKVPPRTTARSPGRGLEIDCPACGKPAGVACAGSAAFGWTSCPVRLDVAPAMIWPYGPALAHEDCCRLHKTDGRGYCDCKASDASDDEHGDAP